MTYFSSSNNERTAEYLSKFNRENVLKLLLKDSSPIIFDIGANNGDSLAEFKSWWSNSIIHCFEPQKACIENLIKRSKLFEKSSIFINHTAAGNRKLSNVVFYTHDIHSGLSGFNKVNLNSRDSVLLNELKNNDSTKGLDEYKNKINLAQTADLIRLDEYMLEYKINKIDLLKIDTQGFEPEVISGLGEKLKDVGIVITELMFYDYYNRSLSFTDIEKYLLPAGFQLFDISHISKNPLNGRTDWVDVIYVNKRILDKD